MSTSNAANPQIEEVPEAGENAPSSNSTKQQSDHCLSHILPPKSDMTSTITAASLISTCRRLLILTSPQTGDLADEARAAIDACDIWLERQERSRRLAQLTSCPAPELLHESDLRRMLLDKYGLEASGSVPILEGSNSVRQIPAGEIWSPADGGNDGKQLEEFESEGLSCRGIVPSSGSSNGWATDGRLG
ncbi:hypothetical protein HK104_004481 [Borealophlyctis nickersoniae]|nr:hypothetical protein HK104_004481 [Borealophlyctis nickersoniae]